MGLKSLLSCCGSQRTNEGHELSNDNRRPIEKQEKAGETKVKRRISWKKLKADKQAQQPKDGEQHDDASSHEVQPVRKPMWSSFTRWVSGKFRPSRHTINEEGGIRTSQIDLTLSPDEKDRQSTDDTLDAVGKFAASIVKDAIQKALAKLIVQNAIDGAVTIYTKEQSVTDEEETRILTSDVDDAQSDTQDDTKEDIQDDTEDDVQKDVQAAGDAAMLLPVDKAKEPSPEDTCIDEDV